MAVLSSTNPVPEGFDPPLLQGVRALIDAKVPPLFVTLDEFPVFDTDPLRDSHRLLDNYFREAESSEVSPWIVKPAQLTAGKAILDTPLEQWAAHLRAAVCRVLFYWTHGVKLVHDPALKHGMWSYGDDHGRMSLPTLCWALLRRNPPLAEQDLIDFIDARIIGGEIGSDVGRCISFDAIVKAADGFKSRRQGGIPDGLHNALARLSTWHKQAYGPIGGDRKDREVWAQLESLLGQAPAGRDEIVEAGEPWAEALLGALEDRQTRARWEPLLQHGAKASGSAPSGKWIKDAKKLIDAIGEAQFRKCAAEWMALAPKPRTQPLREDQITKVWLTECDLYSMKNEDVLKGLAWSCAAAAEPQLAGTLGVLAEACYKKIPNAGPRSPKVGNACLVALTMLPGQEPRAELSRLKAKVKQPTARKMIEKALGKSAAAAGMSTDDLEELAVPAYGFTEVGRAAQQIGEYRADLKIEPGCKVDLSFVDSGGKTRTSPPAELKRDYADPLKKLQQSCKDLGKMLSALRDRLERMPMSRRELPYAQWRERYLDHPVVGALARRLIWSFGQDRAGTVGTWGDGKLVDVNDKPIKPDDKAVVQLWHVSGATADTVLAWRQWLERHEVTQPFKQAHREVYLLTDAERATETYSNRFAAHILQQPVFAALCTQRGWTYRLMGAWDGGTETTPTIELPRWKLRAQFWLSGGQFAERNGVATHVLTDQVRFYVAGNEAPMPLVDVPPLVFSEVMRDVDLFVGVSSIGNDPNWNDYGDNAGEYWQAYSFGELGISAETRRQVLQSLLPRLKIASRCRITDRFLVVKGDLRTYKIHLGSSNILMEPNDQYLCIVPDRSSKSRTVFLPFDGDSTLSIIISKALMLAEDSKITDPTITRQITK